MGSRKIYATSQYKKFKLYKENRQLDERQIYKLQKIIEKRNLLVDMPILVDPDMYVIDGQTRLEVARRLKIPIYYTVATKAERKDISTLNIGMQNWIQRDWLNYYVSLKNRNYIKFRQLMKESGLTIANTLILFHMYRDRRNSFKNGLFVYPEDDAYQRMLVVQLNEWEQIIPGVKTKRSFILAISALNQVKEYQHSRMIKKFREKDAIKTIDIDFGVREKIINRLNEIYNDNMRKAEKMIYFPRKFNRPHPGKNKGE